MKIRPVNSIAWISIAAEMSRKKFLRFLLTCIKTYLIHLESTVANVQPGGQVVLYNKLCLYVRRQENAKQD